MTRNEKLEQEVHEIISCLYRHQFINRLEVLSGEGEQGEPNEYVLKLYLYNQDMGPLAMAYQGDSDESFLNFVVEQLRTKNLVRAQHYNVTLYGNN